nr:hypothetical protein [Tanacetum cinerariifolium]
MSAINQQTLTDSRANDRPPMLKKGAYILWESMFRRHLDNKLEDRERMWRSIQKVPYWMCVRMLRKCGNELKVIDYEEDYQGELHRDSQEDKLITAMMLLARPITQKFSTPTNNCLRTSSNIRNQAVIQDGRFDIQIKNAGYGGNALKDEAGSNLNAKENDFMLDNSYGDETLEELKAAIPKAMALIALPLSHHCMTNAGRQNRNQAFNAENVNDETLKDEAGSNLNAEENDFMLDNSYGDETLEELKAAAASKVNASHKAHEQVNHVKRRTIIHASDDD